MPAPLLPHTPTFTQRHIAVIGGGWAGMAAAVALTQQGHRISLWETSRRWGGRARALDIRGPQGQRWTVDNGQHILIGAYQACLHVMHTVGIDSHQHLLRTPLDLRYADGQGLHLPALPAPWDAVLGIARTHGWHWREKLSLLWRALRWQRQRFRCGQHQTVADLCQGLPPQLLRDFIDPLCISALNLPADQASGTLFLRVLQDGMFSGAGSSNLLIPRTNLGQLFPETAAQWLQARGAQLHLGTRVMQMHPPDPTHRRWQVNDTVCDGVVLATSSSEAARLVLTLSARTAAHQAACEQWAACADTLPHTAIGTVYAHTALRPHGAFALPAPMVALRSPEASTPAAAQFAFDHGQLGGPQGLIALVASTCSHHKHGLQAQALEQARAQLDLPDLQPLQTVIDKRATFACTPSAQRPPPLVMPGLWACGDYVEGPYPATLEGAVRSGLELARAFDDCPA